MKNPLRFIVYRAKDGWRWHACRSGRSVAESGEAYVRRAGCVKAYRHLLAAIKEGKFTSE